MGHYTLIQGVEVPKDPLSGTVATLSVEHAEIHAGRFFSVSKVLTIENGETGALLFSVPDLSKAQYTVVSAGTASNVTLTAKKEGYSGNNISIAFINPGAADKDLEVVVDGLDITVNLATDSGSGIESTAAEVKAAIDAHPDASKLVDVDVQGDGSDEVEANAKENLVGGYDKVVVHFKAASVSVTDGEMTAKIIEDATFTGGSVETPKNRNRLKDRVSQIEVKSNADATVSGADQIELDVFLLGAATSGQTRITGVASQGEEVIFKHDTNYVISVENDSGGQNKANIRIEWYERVKGGYEFKG